MKSNLMVNSSQWLTLAGTLFILAAAFEFLAAALASRVALDAVGVSSIVAGSALIVSGAIHRRKQKEAGYSDADG